MKRRRLKRPAGLKTARELRVGLGISERSWSRMVEEGLPVAEPGAGARPAYVDPVAVAKWIRDRDARVDGARQKSKVMEDLRGEQLRERRRMNDVAEGKLVERDAMRSMLLEISAVMRGEIEACARTHGEAVAAWLRAMIERAEKAWEDRLGKGGAHA